MTAREDWDNTTRGLGQHPSRFSLDEVNPAWDDTDQLAAWDAYYRKNGITPAPTDHPIPDSWAVVLILFWGIVVPWVVIIAAVRWAVS